MKEIIYLRPLVMEDAKISFHWRNISEIWKYTRFKIDSQNTLEREQDWIRQVLERNDQKRFAICLKSPGEYIGNVQIINIANKTAEFHLFIGNEAWWGKGIGQAAAELLLEYAFSELNLERIILEVHCKNLPAMIIYQKLGFKYVKDLAPFIKMELSHLNFIRSNKYENNNKAFSER